jgi:hypothetical protein
MVVQASRVLVVDVTLAHIDRNNQPRVQVI